MAVESNRDAALAADPGVRTRRLAIEAMIRIDRDNAYANLVLPPMLDLEDLSERDRGFVTELVYGTTRMMRACDFLVNRFVLSKIEPQVRAALRIGAYQLHFLDTPAHAAVAATVGAVRGPGKKVVNAVLRRVASAPVEWPDQATRLSYPGWIVERLAADLGEHDAVVALEAMNEAATAEIRSDGYVQDTASQRVVEWMAVEPGEIVVDLCAAPGGKATGLASSGAAVLAADIAPHRVGLIAENVERLGYQVTPIVADGLCPPVRARSVDRVLIDAPCSGLGSLRRRPDARWRIDKAAPERLSRLQIDLVRAGLELLKPGGRLTYSVCTLTDIETAGVRAAIAEDPGLEFDPAGVRRLLPLASDGMAWFDVSRAR
jgi:16S rRNA (cytosine967-C5)-methyltransferase